MQVQIRDEYSTGRRLDTDRVTCRYPVLWYGYQDIKDRYKGEVTDVVCGERGKRLTDWRQEYGGEKEVAD